MALSFILELNFFFNIKGALCAFAIIFYLLTNILLEHFQLIFTPEPYLEQNLNVKFFFIFAELDPLRIDSEKPASKPSSTKTNNRSKDVGMKSQRGNVEPEVKPTKPIDCVSILDSPAESKKSGKETRRNKEKVKELSPDIEILEEKLTISSVSTRSQTPTKKKNEKEIEVNISPGKSNNSRKR